MTATISPDELAFIEAICREPGDDTPRLVFADWLTEHGEEARAEFIRRGVNDGYACGFIGGHDSVGWFTGTHEFGERAGFTIRRGFIDEIDCPADVWLAHADRIAWHPEQTVDEPCGHCRGWGRPGYAPAVRRFGWDKCAFCKGSGTGRVARPCPPTAQPITRVTLTTRPVISHRTHNDAGIWYVLAAGNAERRIPSPLHPASSGDASVADLLAAEWPGITFTLPPEPV